MKLAMVKIGKPATSEARKLAEMYLQRLKPFIPLETVEAKPDWLPKDGLLVTLEEKGKPLSSEALAKQLRKWMEDPGVKRVSFVIGGPYGLSPELVERSDFSWSLSAGTLPSDLAWVLASEQLYRAFTILKGMPYHHA